MNTNPIDRFQAGTQADTDTRRLELAEIAAARSSAAKQHARRHESDSHSPERR